MKANIHPEYTRMQVKCNCGNSFETGSVLGESLHIDVCNACHPFHTGKRQIIDTAGCVGKFAKRFGSASVATP